MGYDSGCYDLAVKFLEDHYDPIPVKKIHELAQEIQDCIELWLEGEGKEINSTQVTLRGGKKK